MENNGIDLRLVIAFFFTIIGILLLITSFAISNGREDNRLVGIIFLIFSAIMYLLAKRKKKEKGSEL